MQTGLNIINKCSASATKCQPCAAYGIMSQCDMRNAKAMSKLCKAGGGRQLLQQDLLGVRQEHNVVSDESKAGFKGWCVLGGRTDELLSRKKIAKISPQLQEKHICDSLISNALVVSP